MKVYLLYLNDGRCVFYSEGPETPAENESATIARPGARGWVERKFRQLQTTLNSAESGVALHMRRAWEWLHSRTAPDEGLLRALRNTSVVHLYYPSTLDAARAQTLWTNYLKGRRRRHTFWLVLNALATPLTVLLAPIPGPNIIGYWFLYRFICHLLALLGVRRALSGQAETELLSSAELDGLRASGGEELWRALAERFDLKNVEAFMKRVAQDEKNAGKAALVLP